ncbi:DpnI domain-containing protein, partial [Salinisphaera shabanensis]|uniref:DpnI domain-containing protein n=1 Tax=Salinisphaera shabanensis TaxID=180542 RepID=UPI003341F07D
MHLKLDESIASGYTSSSQRARVMTEAWAAHNIFLDYVPSSAVVSCCSVHG